MEKSAEHYTEEDLRRFLFKECGTKESGVIKKHLGDCPECKRKLDALFVGFLITRQREEDYLTGKESDCCEKADGCDRRDESEAAGCGGIRDQNNDDYAGPDPFLNATLDLPPETERFFTLVLDGGQVFKGEDCGPFPVGKMEGNRLVIKGDRFVSKMHAEISLVNGRWILYDLGSKNGTFVNSKRIRERALATGDELRFGQTSAMFYDN